MAELGFGNIGLKGNTPTPGPPFVIASAANGLSVDTVTGKIVLGNNVLGVPGAAVLLSSREIAMATFLLRLLYPTAGQSLTFQNDTNTDMITALITNATKTRGIYVEFNNPANPTTTTTGIRLVNLQTNGTIAAILRNDANRGIQMEVLGTTVAAGDITRFVILGGEMRMQCDTVGAFFRWFTSGVTQRMAILPTTGNLRVGANNTDNTAKIQADGTISGDRLVFPRNITPYSVNANQDRGNFFTNEGANAIQVFNLPTAVLNTTTGGYSYSFYVQDVDGLQVVAAAGDTIRVGTSVSAAAGNIQSTNIGSSIRIVCINATEWVTEAVVGSWTVT